MPYALITFYAETGEEIGADHLLWYLSMHTVRVFRQLQEATGKTLGLKERGGGGVVFAQRCPHTGSDSVSVFTLCKTG